MIWLMTVFLTYKKKCRDTHISSLQITTDIFTEVFITVHEKII